MLARLRVHTASMAVAAFGIAAAVSAHVDDPKVNDQLPPYAGPGFRAAEGGVAGMSFPSEGIALQSWITLQEFAPQNSQGNDCWGYTSPTGRKYAIMGTSHGTGFAEVTNPAAAQVIGFIDGPESTWRDIKTYDHYAYAVSEAGQGIQVIDLSDIDNGNVALVNTILAGGSAATHNVAINTDSGYLYRCGGSGNGIRIYSLLEDPSSPAFVAEWPDRYVHDAQIVTYTEGPNAGREIAFLCSGFNNGWVETGIDILDVTDKQNIELLSRYEYPNNVYSHQAWLSEDKNYLYLNDEQDEDQLGFTSTTRVINVANLAAPVQVNAYTNGSNAITHNLYTRGDLVFAANYRSGLRVYDVSSPTTPVEVAFFDTFPSDDAPNFNGLWSNYPFFNDGIVIGSDREKGLFVWAYGVPDVVISYPDGRPEVIDPSGSTLLVEVTQDGGPIQGVLYGTLHVDTGEGFFETPLTAIGNDRYEGVFPDVECGAVVRYYVSVENETGILWRDPEGAPTESYSALVATEAQTTVLDELESETGWTVGASGDDADAGIWVRVDPIGTLAQPEDDHTVDGVNAFVTGQGSPGGPLGEADVDGGSTTLTSPLLDATGEGNAVISYARWYSNDQGNNPNTDSMLVQISDDGGQSWTLLEEVTENAGAWVVVSFRVSDYVTPTELVRLRFIASDVNGGSIVEAGVDDVRIELIDCDDVTEPDPDVNGDGVVDVDDLVLVLLAWGPCDGPCPADIDGNGAVDVDDLILLITNWG